MKDAPWRCSKPLAMQCKTRDYPGAVEMEAIHNFPCPPGSKKLIHRWRDRQCLPDVRVVEG